MILVPNSRSWGLSRDATTFRLGKKIGGAYEYIAVYLEMHIMTHPFGPSHILRCNQCYILFLSSVFA